MNLGYPLVYCPCHNPSRTCGVSALSEVVLKTRVPPAQVEVGVSAHCGGSQRKPPVILLRERLSGHCKCPGVQRNSRESPQLLALSLGLLSALLPAFPGIPGRFRPAHQVSQRACVCHLLLSAARGLCCAPNRSRASVTAQGEGRCAVE